ncbi:MAG: hypothetical protein IKO19_01430, partial [Candidatus Riflebacteria bacterium]|nr:hypothetical protein [Candidatus Riflebacteria bacterium]
MFNTVFDSSFPLNLGLQVLGGIALTLTIIIFFCKKYWDSLKKYIIFLILGLMFFNPFIMFFIFIIFGIMPIAFSSIIYLKKPQEYRIQIRHKVSSHSSNNSKGIKVSSDSEYKMYTYKWWDDKSNEEVYFEVNKYQYDKLYKNEYVYIKSYRGIFGYQHLYKDKDFLRPDEEANKTIQKPTTAKTGVVNNRKVD